MPITTVNGVPIYYEETGKGEPLVLVHGSWIDHQTWQSMVPMLARSFRVLTYDRRGHSGSSRTDRPYSIREEAADLAALIEERGFAPAHVVASSSGGSVALRLAEVRPDLFRSLAVNEPPLFDLLPEQVKEGIRPAAERVVALLEAGNAEAGAREFLETIAFGPGAWEQCPADVKAIVIANAPTFLDEMRDPEFLSIDLEALRRFPHPVLLSIGEQGIPVMPAIVERLAAALPRAHRHTFAGAGHEPEDTHPAEYVTTVEAFITKAATGTTV